MFKILIIYIYLFSLVLCTYRPLPLRNLTFAGDVCYYRDILYNSQIEYVKSCDSGKFCNPLEASATTSPNYEIKTCQEYNNFYKTVGDECSRDFECDSTLICSSSKKCEFNGLIAYNGFCKPGYVYENQGSYYSCVAETESNKDKCETNDVDPSGNLINTKEYYHGYMKICGEIEVQRRTVASDHYIIKTKKASLPGSVPDGNFVLDKEACESGYALYFYGNKDITNPLGSGSTPEMFLLCVTVLGFDTTHNIIKYKIGNEGDIYYYNMEKIPNDYRFGTSTITAISFDEFTMTKLKMFQNYITRFNQIKSECLNIYDINEPGTCRDNELRKWNYFYTHPEEYLLYQNEPDVTEYLIQQEYKEYLPIRNETDNASGFINVSILMILFLLILY